MVAATKNLLFQSEHHPLVPLQIESIESYVLSLIHRKAYARAAGVAAGLEVLDLGCNNGYGTSLMAERAAHVIGVDVSKSAVDAARVTHQRNNVEYRLVDGATLPFGDDSFDLLTSFQVIEHVDDVGSYLREIHRVLRNDGVAIFTTPNRCIRLAPGQKPWNRFHVREYQAEELRKELAPHFSEVTVEGLFAAEALYNIEYNRVTQAKIAAQQNRTAVRLRSLRVSARTKAIIAVKRILPDSVVDRIRGAVNPDAGSSHDGNPHEARAAALANFTAMWSVDDFFYSQERIDEALDLIAICSK